MLWRAVLRTRYKKFMLSPAWRFLMRRFGTLLPLTALMGVSLCSGAVNRVLSSVIDYSKGQIDLFGTNFSPAGAVPTVYCGAITLTPVSITNQQIIATLPASLVPGSYGITVANSSNQIALFDLTI